MGKGPNLATTLLSSLVFALLPMVSHAIGLGNIVLHSHLNEPLDAEIGITDLKGVDPGDVIAMVADQQAYEAAGLQPIGWLTSIRFQVIKGEVAGRPTLKLKTKEAVKDPFVDLLIEVKWPSGTLLREYTLLLDPPKSIIPATRTLKKKHLAQPQTSCRTEIMPSNVSRQLSTTPGGLYGPIDDESLWSIAKSLANNTHSNVHQAVMAIAQKNPHAFRDGNINYMLSGSVLKLPDKAELEQYSLEQSQYYIAMQGPTPTHTMQPVKPQVSKPQKALKLVTPIQALESATKVNRSDPVKAETQVVFAERLNLIEEAIDTLKRSNEDMTKKNQSLQDHNQSLEKLLSMKEEEIKKLVALVKQPNATPISENTPQEQFAIAVSDVPAKPSEDSLASPSLANMTPAKPFVMQAPIPEKTPSETAVTNVAEVQMQPKAVKVDRTDPEHSTTPKAISADEDTPKQSAKPPIAVESNETRGFSMLWIFITALVVVGLLFAWLRRQTLQAFIQSRLKPLLTQSFAQPVLATEQPLQPVDQYGLEFNLDKALDAIATQEKKFKKTGTINLKTTQELDSREKQFEVMYEDAQECISYERFGQAEKILKEILSRKVDEWQAALKLLELYVLTEKYAEFETLYTSLPTDLREISPRIWSKIESLHQRVDNEKAIHFQENPASAQAESNVLPTVIQTQDVKTKEFLDLGKSYKLALEGDNTPVDETSHDTNHDTRNDTRNDTNDDTINIESLPVALNEPSPLIKAQIALAKAYIDMGEYAEAKTILLQLKKDAVGEQATVIDTLLESLS